MPAPKRKSASDPTAVLSAISKFQRVAKHLADLDALAARVAADDPPASYVHSERLAAATKSRSEWEKGFVRMGTSLAQAATGWGMRDTAAVLQAIVRDRAWHNHTVAFDIPPLMTNLQQEAARHLPAPVKPIDEASHRQFVRRMAGPADVQVFANDPKRTLPPLSKREETVLEIIKVKGPVLGPEIVRLLEKDHDVIMEESTLRSQVIPKLKKRGVMNRPRVGYYVDPANG